MPRLILNAGNPQARELVLKEGVNTIGRSEGNDFTINDSSVSGAHCQIIVSNGAVRLRDLGSTNGTFVNGAPVTEAELKAGQQIHLGLVPLMFDAEGTGTKFSPATPRVTTGAVNVAVAAPRPAGLRVAVPSVKAPTEELTIPDSDSAVIGAPSASRFGAPPNAKCKYHPRTLARWVCTGCRKTYCDLCVSERQSPSGHHMFCRSCGAAAAPLDVTIEAPKEKSFFRELPRALVYPFRGSGPFVLFFATIIFAGLEFLSKRSIIGFLIWLIAVGYLYSYMQNILHSTAAEEEQMPDMPGWDDILNGFGRLAGTVLISFGPALVLGYLAIKQELPALGIAMIPAAIFGAVYLPMAFLVVAMKDNVLAANPLIVVPSILRVPLEYLVTAFLVGGMYGVRWLGDALTTGLAGASMMGTSVNQLVLLLVLQAIWAFVNMYLLTVMIRILGLLYVTKRERLGW